MQNFFRIKIRAYFGFQDFDLIAKTQNLTAYKPGFCFELGKFF